MVRSKLNVILAALTVLAGRATGEESVRAGLRASPLLVNGDFEAGADGDVPGWSRSFYPQREGNVGDCLGRSDERARSGGWSLKVDTGPVVGEEVTLVFNGAVAPEAARLKGQRLVLSGWVYVEPDTAARPVGMRLRTFGPDAEGKNAFRGDVLEVKVLGRPGEWVPFRATGTVAEADLTSLDLHCSLRPDAVRTVQFLDDLRLEPFVPPPLEIRLLCEAVWQDESYLPVEVRVNQPGRASATLEFRALTPQGKAVREWKRPPSPLDRRIEGLPLWDTRLNEGSYQLRAELRRGRKVLASAEASLEVVQSPWQGMARASQPQMSHPPRTPARPPQTAPLPEGFQVLGTVAPTEAPDEAADEPEPLSGSFSPGHWQRWGYAVFSRHYLDRPSRSARPRPGELDPVRLFACPGEYEPATVSVWALRPQTEVRLTVSDLTRDLPNEPGMIAASQVDVRVVRTIKGLPPFLEKREAVDLPEGQTQTFWLTVHVPPDAAPGFYHGNIEVAPRGSLPEQVELIVRVLPLKLPPPPKGYGFWWKMDGRWKGYYSEERDAALEQIRRQFILLREHGCNMVSCYGMPKMSQAADGTITFDFAQDHWGHDQFSLADFFRLGRETGLFSSQVPLQYTGADSLHSDWIARSAGLDHSSAAFEDFYRDACRRVDQWAKEQGFTLAFASVDEIGNSEERRQDALRFYRLAQEAGVLTSVTDNSMHAGMHLMGQPRFDDLIAMRLYNFITPEMIEHTRHSGDHLWLYNLGSGGWDAPRDRFVFGLFTERCGAEGCSQWAFQWPPGSVNPYEAAAAGQSSGWHYALPAPDGPLPTLAMEGVREGIDDARYLALLSRGNGTLVPDYKPPQSEAASLDDIEPFSTGIADYLEGHRGNSFDVRRWRIAREAMKAERR